VGALNMKMINPSEDRINEVVAVEVAGWTHVRSFIRIRTHDRIHILKGFPPGMKRSRSNGRGRQVPAFTRSADAVLPLLEKQGYWSTSLSSHASPAVSYAVHCGASSVGYADEFPLAACIALLRSKGISVEFTGEGRT